MAETTGWETQAIQVGTDRRRVQLNLPKQTDEANALALWRAVEPLLADGRLKPWDGPWDTMCQVLAKGWVALAKAIQTTFPIACTDGKNPAWFRWRDTVQALRRYTIHTQRTGLALLTPMAQACASLPDGHATIRGMNLGDAVMALRLQPGWATQIHTALQGMPEPKPGKAQEQDLAHLAAILASAHGRLAVAGWAWPPTLLLGSAIEADRVARKLLGFPTPKEQRLMRKRARQIERGRHRM
jgi:hypothetical protein